MSEAATVAPTPTPLRAPYTVDDLFELPDDGQRYEVFGGSLYVSPPPAPMHQLASGALPCDVVHTVVEVVSPSNALIDRAYKRELYAEAGIPCHWRVELNPWRAYQGPLPLIVVRLRDGDGWRTIEAAAGATAALPLAVGRSDQDTIDVRLDPAVLVEL